MGWRSRDQRGGGRDQRFASSASVNRAAVTEARAIDSAASKIPAAIDPFEAWPALTIHWNGNAIASAMPTIPPRIDVIRQPLERS